MTTRAKAIVAEERANEKAARGMTESVHRWLRRYAKQQTEEILSELKTGQIKLRKADDQDAELMEILTKFGLREMRRAGKQVTSSWQVPPELVREVIRAKKVNVKNIQRGAVRAVRKAIRDAMLRAESEVPQPSTAVLSRRIRKAVAGLHAFSRERAALVARTEAKQNRATGIIAGMDAAGVEEIEWLSSKNPRHGDRRHDLMNGMVVQLGAKFTNPTTGRELRYPGDPEAHISETANCGCTFAPARKKAKKRAA
jgi:hypothetical protein